MANIEIWRYTGNATVGRFQKLFVAARIAKERRVDDNRALPASCACAVQQEMHVDVAVPCVGNFAECRHQCVISTVACRLEYQHICVGRAEDVEYRVEAGVLLNQMLTYISDTVSK